MVLLWVVICGSLAADNYSLGRTGLDSSTSYSLVEKLQHLAAMGRTIVTTIHQPSTDIFFKFDRLMLLADGHMVYNGPTKDVVAYFAKLGYKCPKYTNPAEFISASPLLIL